MSLTCEPWADIDDLCGKCAESSGPTPSPEQIQAASDLLFLATAKQYPGLCTKTVRPTPRFGAECYGYLDLSGGGFTQLGTADLGPLSQRGGLGGAGEEEWSGPSWVSAITLGYTPLNSVTEVKIDGAVLDPSQYRVDDGQFLVRLPDAEGRSESWPVSQRLDLPTTEAGTFSVEFKYGQAVPEYLRHAAAIVACEFALACSPRPEDCRLPQRVSTVVRQGVTQLMLDPLNFLHPSPGQPFTFGIYEVDLAIKAANPNGLQQRASVVSPDLWPPSRETTWTAP